MRTYILIYIAFLAIAGSFGFSAAFAIAGDVAIIVNPENRAEDLSYRELVKIFKKEKEYWKNGAKIYLVLQESGSMEKELVLNKIYKMNNMELKKFWLRKMFKGEIPSFPKTLGSNEGAKRFVSRVPNAIGFIDSGFLDDTVKALKVNGKMPSDNGYILSEDKEGAK